MEKQFIGKTLSQQKQIYKRERRKAWGPWDGSGRKCLPHKREGLSSDLQHHMTRWAWCGTIDICNPSAGPETGRFPEFCGQHSSQMVSSGLREEDFEKKKKSRESNREIHPCTPMVNLCLWLFRISTCAHVDMFQHAHVHTHKQACIRALDISIYAEINSGSIWP